MLNYHLSSFVVRMLLGGESEVAHHGTSQYNLTFLFPPGSWCQGCSSFWWWPLRITNAQMRIGGESGPDSDVLQLVAGVRKRSCSASHWHACTAVHAYVCGSACCPEHPSAHQVVCALAGIWCGCVWVWVHMFMMPLSLYMWPAIGGGD